jgi:hypothetical protein
MVNQRKIILYLFIVFFVIFQVATPIFCQIKPENIFWIKSLNENVENKLNQVIKAWGSGYIIAGNDKRHHWIINLDSDGNTKWEIKLEKEKKALIYLGKIDPFRYEAIYYSYKDKKGIHLKSFNFDNNGTIRAEKEFIIEDLNYISSIVRNKEHDYLILGTGNINFLEGIKEYIPSVSKLDKNGRIIWQKYLEPKKYYKNFKDKAKFFAKKMIQASDGGCLISGEQIASFIDKSSMQENEKLDYNIGSWIAKIDKHGEVEWAKTFHQSNITQINCVIETNDNHFLLVGRKGSHWNWFDSLLIKIRLTGETEWERSYDKVEIDEISSVIQSPDNHYLVASYFANYGGHKGISFLKLKNTNGLPLWEKVFKLDRREMALFEYGKNCYLCFIDCMAIKFANNEMDIPVLKTVIAKKIISENRDSYYSVQISTFKHSENAQNLLDELLIAKFNAFIEKKITEEFYRVFVGVFKEILSCFCGSF